MPGLLQKLTGKIGDDFYRLMPSDWRRRDGYLQPCKRIRNLPTTDMKFHARLLALIGDVYEDQIVIPIQNVLAWHDPLGCPIEMLPILSLEMGWPLDTSLDETTQRLIVRSIKTLVYDEIGNLPEGLINAIYGFTGLEVDIWTFFNGNGSDSFGYDIDDVGYDMVGSDSFAYSVPNYPFCFGYDSEIEGCGYDGQAQYSETNNDPYATEEDRRALFTFVVDVTGSSADQLKLINFLCDYMRPARMHYIIREV